MTPDRLARIRHHLEAAAQLAADVSYAQPLRLALSELVQDVEFLEAITNTAHNHTYPDKGTPP
jgi:hypothetical protein